jgi:ubiquinone/menaquinone biosynthesis C-methylase UbiE
MSHDNEYHDNVVTMLELIWGEGYMAPGGPGNVAKLLDGIETPGKRILDVGCGIGGPAFEIARAHNAKVLGIDLEAPLIERATAAANDLGLENQCEFMTVEPGPLPFDDQSFDIVLTSGALTQTSSTKQLVDECYRVLAPGGHLTCYEWMKSEREYSDDMYYWFKMEGLTYALNTLDEFAGLFRDSGFSDIVTTDASSWYRAEARREYELIRGELYPRMVELLGQADADHFVEDWRAMVIVIETGEMRQGYCRGRRPG